LPIGCDCQAWQVVIIILAWFWLQTIPDDAKTDAVKAPITHHSEFFRSLPAKVFPVFGFLDNIYTMKDDLASLRVYEFIVFDGDELFI